MRCWSVSRFVRDRVASSAMRAFKLATRRSWTLGLAVALLGLALAPAVPAVEAGARAEVRVPQSPQDHLELAALYLNAATENHKRTEALRKSWAAEIKRQTPFPNKAGIEFPWLTRLKRQAQEEISEADQAASAAERAAEYHRLRARELEGLEFAALSEGQR